MIWQEKILELMQQSSSFFLSSCEFNSAKETGSHFNVLHFSFNIVIRGSLGISLMEFTIYLLLHRAAFGGFLLFALSLFYQLFHISIF